MCDVNEAGDFENVDDEQLVVDTELKGGETGNFFDTISDTSLTYVRLLTEKLNENLVVVNQGGDFRVFNLVGAAANVDRCHICYGHSNKSEATKQLVKIRLDKDGLSITKATHHPNCTSFSEREIAFQEFDHQCHKLVKEEGLNRIKAYEKARTFAFHYHYSTTPNAVPIPIETDEPVNKRRRIEHDQELLPNYDLIQSLEDFVNRENGVSSFKRFRGKCDK